MAVILVAILARTWNIMSMPGGLFPDQAANGEDAIAILHGDLRPFYERGNGREALFFYIQAGLIALFGIGVGQMFLASSLVGSATVIASYLAASRLFGRQAGLLATVFLATNQWHVTLSRTGFRAILVPLFIALTIYFIAGVAKAASPQRRILEALGAGVAFGLGWYTYIAFRAFAGVLLISGIVLLLQDAFRKPRFRGLRMQGGALLIAVVAASLVLLPLSIYFANHPDAFIGRAGHVSVLNPDLNKGDVAGTVLDVVEKSVLAFFLRGDTNPRHNVAGFPFLSPLPAMFLLVGLAVATVRAGQYLHRLFRGRRTGGLLPHFAALLLALLMLAPAVATAEGIPHGLRSIGEIPVVFWLAGIGAAWALHKFRQFPSLAARRLAQGLFAVLLLLTMAYELSLYFVVSAASPAFWYEYRTDLTDVSRYLTERAQGGRGTSYLALDAFSAQTTHFLTTAAGHPYILVRPEESLGVNLEEDDVIIFTQSTIPDARRFAAVHPDARIIETRENRFGEETMVVFDLP